MVPAITIQHRMFRRTEKFRNILVLYSKHTARKSIENLLVHLLSLKLFPAAGKNHFGAPRQRKVYSPLLHLLQDKICIRRKAQYPHRHGPMAVPAKPVHNMLQIRDILSLTVYQGIIPAERRCEKSGPESTSGNRRAVISVGFIAEYNVTGRSEGQ